MLFYTTLIHKSVQYFFCAMHDMALQLPTTALQEDSALQPATRGCSDHQSFKLEIVLLTLSHTSRFASCNMFFGSDSRWCCLVAVILWVSYACGQV